MSDVFISYSRKDIAFARLIREALQQSHLEPWIDWERIPVGERWWTEITQAIQNANVFMFIISRHSVGSQVCKAEIDLALQNNKRIIPIVVDDLQPAAIKEFAPELPQFNWIIFEQDHIFQLQENPAAQAEKPEDRVQALPMLPQFEEALKKLSSAIHTDWDWVKFHTRLQVDALRWENNQRDPGYLIRAAELEEAEQQVLRAGGKDPQPTTLQAEFITASRQEETRRQQEQLQLEQKASQRQRFALWAVGVGLVVAVMLGILAWSQRNTAVNQSNIRATAESNAVAEAHSRATAEANAVNEAQVRATAEAVAVQQRNVAVSKQLAIQADALVDSQLDLALLLAVKAADTSQDLDSRSMLLKGILHVPYLEKVLASGVPDNNLGVAFSPNGRFIAAGIENDVVLFDAVSGQRKQTLWDFIPAQVDCLVYNPDGSILAVGRAGGQIVLWDTLNPYAESPIVLNHNSKVVTALAFSPDGRYLASGARDGTIIIWEVGSGEALFAPLQYARIEITTLDFSPDGDTLAAGDVGSSVVFWSINNGEMSAVPLNTRTFWGLGTNSENFWVSSITYHPDGKHLAVAAGLGAAFIDLVSGQALNPLPRGHNTACGRRAVHFTSDGTIMVSGGCGELKATLVENFVDIFVTSGSFANSDSLAISPDNQTFVTSSVDGNILQWRLKDEPWAVQEMMPGQAELITLDYAVKTGFFAAKSACLGGTCTADEIAQSQITIWNEDNFMAEIPLEDPGMLINDLVFSPDGKLLAGTSYNLQKILIWDVNSRTLLRQMSAQQGFSFTSLGIDPQGKLLIAAGCAAVSANQCDQGAFQAWDVESGQALASPVLAHTGNIQRVLFQPDGKRFATASSDGKVILWNSKDFSQLETILMPEIFTGGIYSLAFSADGRQLAAGTGKGMMHLWQLEEPAVLSASFSNQSGWTFYAAAFSQDGRSLIGGSMAGELYLWDLDKLKQVGPRIMNNDRGVKIYIDEVFINQDNDLWVVGGNGISRWQLSDALLQEQACQIANRNLTAVEWEQYFPDDPYQDICPGRNSDYGVFNLLREQAGVAEMAAGSPEILEFYDVAIEWARASESAERLYQVCWWGSLEGAVQQVLPLCEEAVRLDGHPVDYDSLALALAINGDLTGAAEAFQIYVDWLRSVDFAEESALEREGWIAELLKGKNPFTAELLNELRTR